MMRLPRCARIVLAAGLAACTPMRTSSTADAATTDTRPLVVVTTDAELDDSNSLVRYLLFSTDFRTEGLVYASSQFHWKGDGTGRTWFVPNREYRRFGLHLCPCTSWRWAPDEHWIDDAVDIYARVYPDLRVHDGRYPAPAELKSKIRWGNVAFDGDISQDTPGSDLIRQLLLDDEPGPVYLLAWGGQSTIARALKSIQDRYASTPQWRGIYEKVSRKAILSTSGDQDDTYATYIRPNWPDIRILPAGVGGVRLDYFAPVQASPADSVYYGTRWTRDNVSSRGPFGAFYRVWGDGKQMVKNDIFDHFGFAGLTTEQLRAMGYVVWIPPRAPGSFIGEGDTFTYLNLLDNGLAGYRDDTPGGWAGAGDTTQRHVPGPDFTSAAQNAFAARLLWSVTPARAGANHEPVITLRGAARVSARAGETVPLAAAASDPDGNRVHVRWWQWRAMGTYPRAVPLADSASAETTVRVPDDARPGQTIQLVVQATDDGAPPLTRYQRVVITVR